MHYNKSQTSGFILPALVVFSLVLMSVGLVAMQYVTSSTGRIQTTFYSGLAKEAANAGAAFAYQCLRDHNSNNIYAVPWNGGTLYPNYNCSGLQTSNPTAHMINSSVAAVHDDIPSASPTSRKGWLNETKGPSIIRTSFSVPTPPSTDISDSGAKITATGKVEFFYAGSSTPTRTIEQQTIVNIPINMNDVDVQRAEGRAVTQVESGMNFSCAVANQEMYCWGANNANQLGLSHAAAQGYVWKAPFGNSPPNCGGGILGWACDTGWNVLVTAWYTAWSYGAGFFGGLYDTIVGTISGVTNAQVNRPTRNAQGAMSANRRVDNITASTISGCGVVEGRGVCWGSNPHGQIGNGDKSMFLETIYTMLYLAALIPDSAGGAGMVLAAVYAFNMASDQFFAGDDLYTSGRYYPTYIGSSDPLRDPQRWDQKNISKIATSASSLLKVDRNNTCAISNGEVGCWGNNSSGQMNTPIYAAGSKQAQTCPTDWVDREPVWGNRTFGIWPAQSTRNVPYTWATTRNGVVCNQGSNYVAPICALGSVGATTTDTHRTIIRPAGNPFNYNETWWAGFPPLPFSHSFSGNQWNNEWSSPTSVAMRSLCRDTNSTVEVGAPAVLSGFVDFDNYVPRYMLGYGPTEGKHLSHLFEKRALDVAGGIDTPCALVGAGQAYCWGGGIGALGVNTTLANTASNTRKQIPGNTPLTSIAGGGNTHCGIGHGKLYCWGSYRGNGTSGSAPIEVAIPAGVTLDKVDGFNDNTGAICATGNGDAYCFGKNLKWKGGTWGGSQATPELYGGSGASRYGLPEGKITQIAPGAGGDNVGAAITSVLTNVGAMCAVVNATPYCMGDNAWGQLGRGNTNNSTSGANNVNVFNRTHLPAGTTSGMGDANTIGLTRGEAATAIDAGNGFTCAVINAQPYCWGRNNAGQLGIGNTNSPVAKPTAASYIGGNYTTRISAGGEHACSVTDGKAYCWGNNGSGRLGHSASNTSIPAQVTDTIGSMAITDISAGAEHTCAVANSQAYCWGAGGSGRLGNGSTANSTAPVHVSALSGKLVTRVAAGSDFSCAIADGQPYCWGANASGQLGNGTTTARNAPSYPVGYNPTTGAALASPMSGASTEISAGNGFACAVEGGFTRCWGAGGSGRLGNGGTGNSLLPVNVAGGLTSNDNSTSLGVGDSHGCALTGGYLRCWGAGGSGRLGNGGTGNSSNAVTVREDIATTHADPLFRLGTNNKPTAVTTGTDHSCAIANGKIFCWGANATGQLGTGATSSQSTDPIVTTTYARGVRTPAWENTVFY